MTNIRFAYLYRDAGNYKQYGGIILSNRDSLAVDAIEGRIRACLQDGGFFIARQVKVAEHFFDVMTADDHPWHEFVLVEETADPVCEDERDIAQFLAELEQAHRDGWDETDVPADLIQQIGKEQEALKRRLDDRGDKVP